MLCVPTHPCHYISHIHSLLSTITLFREALENPIYPWTQFTKSLHWSQYPNSQADFALSRLKPPNSLQKTTNLSSKREFYISKTVGGPFDLKSTLKWKPINPTKQTVYLHSTCFSAHKVLLMLKQLCSWNLRCSLGIRSSTEETLLNVPNEVSSGQLVPTEADCWTEPEDCPNILKISICLAAS